jgi:hypothetical protein
MSDTRQVYEDEFGAILTRPAYNELRWYDATEGMTKGQFQDWLTTFADEVTQAPNRAILVDATSFLMDVANMDGSWRDANIVPRYNAAGVTKFAFLMPRGMPAIGAPPAKEGPADYETAYFGTRRDALRWIGARNGPPGA